MDKHIIERFWRSVKRGAPDDCWPWLTRDGTQSADYGKMFFRRANGSRYSLRASRVSYLIHIGPISDGLLVRHRCDNPPCCNPAHLQLGTHADNIQDMFDRGRAPRRSGLAAGDAAKLTQLQVSEIRARYVTTAALAREYGVHQSTIRQIVQCQSWPGVE